MEKKFTLLDLWQLIKKNLVRIINMTILGATLSALVVMFFVEPQYSSQAQLIVNQRSDQESSLQYNEIQSNVTLVSTYRDIILGDGVLTAVNNNLDNHFSIKELRNAITIEQSTDSQAFNISVEMESPDAAQNIVNNVITEFEKTLLDIYGEDVSNVYIVSSASYNPSPVSPNLVLLITIGGFVGGMLMISIVLVIELLDSRVKSSEDLLDMGMVALGEIYELSDRQKADSKIQSKRNNSSNRKRV